MSLDYDHYKNGGLLKERYLKVDDISEGAYGIVSLAEDHQNEKKLVAVKYITQFTTENGNTEAEDSEKDISPLKTNRENVSKSEGGIGMSKTNSSNNRAIVLEEAKQEIAILTKLGSHPNITKLYDSFDSYLILEYCSRGDLYEIIRGSCGPTSARDIIDVMSQLIDAVSYAHSLGIYHRDIKPENILVTEDWTIKLTDWGLATNKQICTDFDVGSERYMAPELFDNKNIDSYDASKCDIWSLGICLLNIVFGKNPFTVANQSDKLFVHFAANRETIFDIFPTMSYELFGILRYALTIDPENRDLESMKQEMSKVKHLTLDYDLESVVSENESKFTAESEGRSKSNPIIALSPERKFVHGGRKPLAIPSTRYRDYYNNRNHYNGNNNNNNNNNGHSSYNRQDFFTPKSVFNNYMDKVDKNRFDPNSAQPKNRNTHYKKKIPNKRAWRKSYKRPPTSKNFVNDGVFLKPNSIKKLSPPSTQDMRTVTRKRYSASSHSSSVGKYVPPALRSPNIDPARYKIDSTAIIDDTEFDPDDADIDDEDELFMLEEYQNSPKLPDRRLRSYKNNDLTFQYPNSKSSRGPVTTSSKLQTITSTTEGASATVHSGLHHTFLTPAALMSSSSNGSQGKYVPPHHRRNSHSAVLNNKGTKPPQQRSKRNSFLSSTEFEPSSVPTSWSNTTSMGTDKLSKANQKFDKNYTQEDFNVNDMYHTFAKMSFDSSIAGNTQKEAGNTVFTSDDDDEDEVGGVAYHSLSKADFKFATRAIPSYTS